MSAYISPRLLDNFDIFLLVAIGQGVDSCTYLANSTSKAKSTISARIQVLQHYKLIDVVATTAKHFSREYQLTPTAKQLIADAYFDFNKNYLDKLKNLGINSQVVE